MDVLVTSKNKEEPNKNEGASMATKLNMCHMWGLNPH